METKKLQLLVTSDIHGYIMPTTFRQTIEPLGLTKVASLIEKLRQQRPTILIDNGDLIQGSPLTYYHHAFHKEEPNPIIKAVNDLHYDLAIFGNHEFNYGLPYLNDVIEQSSFPWLSGNIFYENGTPFTEPYIIKEIDGVCIGIIGLTTHFVPVWEDPKHIEGLYFHDTYKSAEKWIKHLRQNEKVDVVVLCYHGGFSHDLISGELIEANTGENQGYQICKDLDFDVFITGHQHREIASKVFGKSVVQPGTKGNCLAVITLDIEMKEDKVISILHEPSLHYVEEDTPVHPQIALQIEDIHLKTEKWLDEAIGRIDGNLLFTDAFQVRVQKHPYIELIQRIQMEYSNTLISCTALFHDGPGGFPSQVTMRHIVNNYIYPNTLKVLKVSGKHIVEALEQNASYFSIENGSLTVSKHFLYPKTQPYNYDMWEGINYIMDIRQPVGKRVTEVTFQGKSIDPQTYYDVVMNNYRATGAGNFPYFAECQIIKDIQIDMTELIARYFEKYPSVQANCHQNWKILFE